LHEGLSTVPSIINVSYFYYFNVETDG